MAILCVSDFSLTQAAKVPVEVLEGVTKHHCKFRGWGRECNFSLFLIFYCLSCCQVMMTLLNGMSKLYFSLYRLSGRTLNALKTNTPKEIRS